MDLNNLQSQPIVVIGGGFGGLSTVVALLAKAEGIPILLIDQSSRFVFKPFLYELLSNEMQLWEVAPSYSELAAELGFIFLQESVVEIDEIKSQVTTAAGKEFQFSQLVISTGMKTDYPGLAFQQYCYGCSDLNDIMNIRKLIKSIKHSSKIKSPLVIAGAGPTGVELACKIADLVNNKVAIYLIDKGTKILPNSKAFNREASLLALEERNIKILLKHLVKSVNKDHIELESLDLEIHHRKEINYSGLIWTGGLSLSSSELLTNYLHGNKKIKVNEFMQVNGSKNIFFVGDLTLNDHNPYPSSAQVATQQGFLTAQNIFSLRKGHTLKPFLFKDRGEILSLGIGNAALTGYGITLSGPLAFEIRRLAYLKRMPGIVLFLKSGGSWLFSKKFINRLFSYD
tara:strand:- start:415 stop:1611 length:1197 start_codon:yes stop_codon:yes gene_type:complete